MIQCYLLSQFPFSSFLFWSFLTVSCGWLLIIAVDTFGKDRHHLIQRFLLISFSRCLLLLRRKIFFHQILPNYLIHKMRCRPSISLVNLLCHQLPRIRPQRDLFQLDHSCDLKLHQIHSIIPIIIDENNRLQIQFNVVILLVKNTRARSS